MITLYKTFEIEGGTAPYSYKWMVNTSCITIEPLEGTSTDGKISATFSFSTEECLTNNPVFIEVIDGTGLCILNTDVTISNPCTDLTIVLTASASTLIATATASGGTPPYTYSWQYDTNTFEVLPENTSLMPDGILKLKQKPDTVFNVTSIIASVTDAYGCYEEQRIYLEGCPPSTSTISYPILCINNNYFLAPLLLTSFIKPCTAGSSIDWTSMNISGLPSSMSYSVNSYGVVSFSLSGSIADGYYTATYTIKDSNGLQSNPAYLTIVVPECGIAELNAPLIGDNVVKFKPSEKILNSTYTFDISKHNEEEVDWNTFEFLPKSGQTVSSDKKTLTVSGTAEINFDHNNKINYKFLGTSSTSVNVAFKVAGTSSNDSNTALWVFDSETIQAPSVTDQGMCASCEQITPYTDILTTASGYLPGTLEIVSSPSYGTLQTSSDQVAYLADQTVSSSTDTFTYKIKNSDGEYSNTGTITVYRTSAGIAPSTPVDITCVSKILNLEDQLSGQKDSGTWSDYTGDYTALGGVISDTTLGSVDFSSIRPGDYVFKKTVTSTASGLNCPVTSTAYVTIRYLSVPGVTNDECSSATTINCPLATADQYAVTDQTFLGSCPFSTGPTLSSVALPAGWSSYTPADLWYSFTYQGTLSTIYVTVIGGTLVNPQIAVYNDPSCNCNTSSMSLMASSSVSTGSRNLSVSVSGFNVGQCYRIRVSVYNSASKGDFTLYVSGSPII